MRKSRISAGPRGLRGLIAGCAIAAGSAIALWPSAAVAMPGGSGAFHGPFYAPAGAQLPFGGPQQAVCDQEAAPGAAQCLIHVLSPGSALAGSLPGSFSPSALRITEVATPYGLSPARIKAVYGYSTSSTAGAGETIALVDAYNDPDAASDLSKFSAQYGLPAASFTQVNQTGGSTLPATESSWDLEISLDIEWAHALAPGAKILLVEATSNSLSNLLAAESYASAHANYVSNSWGSSEFSGESAYNSYLSTPGVSYFAASGDEGSAMLWPSASPDVTSVGGTSLTFTSGGTLAQEEAWSGGGGGCSRYETASPAQITGSVSCAGKRATPDVALDANPNSGVSVYDSVAYDGQTGWWTVGGTSASTAMVAANAAAAASQINAPYVYSNPAKIPFRDIILGSNGHPTLTGYDLATGLGTWSNTPGAPTSLTAKREASAVKLAWSAPTGAPSTEYVIWRGSTSGQETTELATVEASQTTYTDLTAPTSTLYYEIQAVDSAGSGPFSGQAEAAGASVPPVAKFTTSCAQTTCNFKSSSTDASGTINAYAWNGGNGRTGSASTFSDTYASAGIYSVTLIVTNTAGQSSSPFTEEVTCSATPNRPGHGHGGGSTLTCT